MALNYSTGIVYSTVIGVIFALVVAIRYLAKIEKKQNKLLNKIIQLEETIKKSEAKIIQKLNNKKEK